MVLYIPMEIYIIIISFEWFQFMIYDYCFANGKQSVARNMSCREQSRARAGLLYLQGISIKTFREIEFNWKFTAQFRYNNPQI